MSALPARHPAAPTFLGRPSRPEPVVEVTPTRAQRSARPRLLAAIGSVVGLFGILAAQLLLTIATSEGAYEISALQAQQSELGRDQQVLVEQLQVLDAPQHLAAEAQALGMVAGSSAAYLRLSDGVVLGTPTAASESSALVTAPDGSPLIPNSLLADVPSAAGAAAGAAGAAAAAGAGVDAPADATSPIPVTGTDAPAAGTDTGTVAPVDGTGTGAPTADGAVGSVASSGPTGIPTPNTH